MLAELLKPEAKSLVGVTLEANPSGAGVIITAINPQGIAAACEHLAVGHVIASINGTECDDANAAAAMLRSAEGQITLQLLAHTAPKPLRRRWM